MLCKLIYRFLVTIQDLEAISLASVQLQSSKSFKKVLEVVLALGNYMNAGNYRIGGAVGFRIAFLAQVGYTWEETMRLSPLYPSPLFSSTPHS